MTKARDLANSAAAFSAVSATELGYVDGVTSAIQTQLDAKAASSTAVTLTGTQTLTNKTLTSPVIASVINNTLTSTTGDIIYASAANTPTRLGIGSSAQILTVASGIPSWATPAGGGLVFINATSYSSSSSISVNNVFSTTYDNYRILICGNSTGASCETTFRFRVSSTDTTANYKGQEIYAYSTTIATRANLFGTDEIYIGDMGSSTVNGTVLAFDVIAPFLTAASSIAGLNFCAPTPTFKVTGGSQTDATSFTGFTIIPAVAATGSIYVYGYAKA